MITLHAGESNGALVLWGEASGDDGVRSTSRRRGTKAPYASLHPLAASTGELTEALRKMLLGLKPAASPACHVTAWLPTRGDSPVPSSALIAEPPRSRAKAKLAPWTVAAYPMFDSGGGGASVRIHRQANARGGSDRRCRPGVLGGGAPLCRIDDGAAAVSPGLYDRRG